MTVKDIKALLGNGGLETELAVLSGENAAVQANRYLNAVNGFQAFFSAADNQEIGVYSAPGRAEICGNHTDHQRGLVLAAAVNADVIAVAAAADGPVRIKSEGYDEITVDNLTFDATEAGTPIALVKGVLRYFADNGITTGGANIYITSEVLEGSGLSSSAAFETLMGSVFGGLFLSTPPTPLFLAMAGKYAENVYFGKPSGLMDQMASAFGGFIYIDFSGENPVCERIDSGIETFGHVLAIVNTGSGHEELTDDYAAIPREMRSVAAALGKEVLGQCDETTFYQALPRLRQSLDDRALLRAIHFFDENRRVTEAARHLKSGDFQAFLSCVNTSGQSSLAFLQNVFTTRVRNQPITLALALSRRVLGNLGACRVHGGGFAGTILAMVPADLFETYRASMDCVFGAGSCKKLAVRGAGACRVI